MVEFWHELASVGAFIKDEVFDDELTGRPKLKVNPGTMPSNRSSRILSRPGELSGSCRLLERAAGDTCTCSWEVAEDRSRPSTG